MWGRGFVTANRDFFWLNAWTDGRDYQLGFISTFAFSVDNGALIGPLTGPVSPLNGTPCVVCGGYGLPYLSFAGANVIGGGRRLVTPVNGSLEIHDLSGTTAISSTLIRRIPIVGGVANNEFAYDADDFGNLVVAGATTSTVVFSTTAAAAVQAPLRTEDSGSARAFVTRNPAGRVPLKLSPFVPLEIELVGANGIPASGVSAVSMNVTVTETEGNGYVTIYPCGPRRLVSSLNYVANQTVPNAVITPVSPSGSICFYSTKPAHLLADVNGWFGAGASFHAVDPTRLFDTRIGEPAALDISRTKVGPAQILEIQVAGNASVPAGAAAVSMNVTVTGAGGAGFVTAFPCNDRPLVSSLNFTAGQTVPNAVIAPLSPSGTVCFFASADTDLLADVNGWFASGAGFNPVAPTRLFDTRPGERATLDVSRVKVGGSAILEVPVAGVAGVPPSGATAVSLNITATQPDAAGFVTIYPCDGLPNASSLNFVAGQTVPNAVIAPLSTSGTICLFSNVATHLIADVNGWFSAGGGFEPLRPNRAFDTR